MSLLVHEYGHALTALYFGASPEISLEAFGGRALYSSQKISPKQDFLITLNGPLLESLLIIVSYALLQIEVVVQHPYLHYFLYSTLHVNIVWCLLNLIPITPLDGGHLASYLLQRKFGLKGELASIIIGLICVAVIAPYLFYKGFYVFGTLLLIFGFQNYQILRGIQTENRSPYSCYIQAMHELNNEEQEKGKQQLHGLLKSKDTQIKHSAIEALAKVYVDENQREKAYGLLLKADHKFFREGKCLLCKLAFENRNYELVNHYSRDIYEIEPTYEIALLNSKANAVLNQPALAGAWLVTASQFGPEYKLSIPQVLQLPIYDSVRDHDTFRHHLEKI